MMENGGDGEGDREQTDIGGKGEGMESESP